MPPASADSTPGSSAVCIVTPNVTSMTKALLNRLSLIALVACTAKSGMKRRARNRSI